MSAHETPQGDTHRSIYVLDDDPDICRLVCAALREFGFDCESCHTASALRRLLSARVPDLCIVDLGLPDADGMDVVRELQDHHGCCVLVLSGRGYLSDRVMGLELGADDFVVKPFEPRELVARVRSILRRRDKGGHKAAVGAQTAEFGGWHFRAHANALSAPGGQSWTLSAGESRMLLQFLQSPNRILAREQLCGERDFSPLDRGVDVRVSRLRRKLESDPQKPTTIRTVYGAGYLMVADVRWLKPT